jgi:predicted Rossmann fold nucleotide-binding protein DprA/Smf involved in DNA uptake
LAGGAQLVRGAQDVLDHIYGAGVRAAQADARTDLPGDLRRLLAAVSDGQDTPAALERQGFPPERSLAALASLELEGYVRRLPGGRFAPIP